MIYKHTSGLPIAYTYVMPVPLTYRASRNIVSPQCEINRFGISYMHSVAGIYGMSLHCILRTTNSYMYSVASIYDMSPDCICQLPVLHMAHMCFLWEAVLVGVSWKEGTSERNKLTLLLDPKDNFSHCSGRRIR